MERDPELADIVAALRDGRAVAWVNEAGDIEYRWREEDDGR
jgi:hypothetical protein